MKDYQKIWRDLWEDVTRQVAEWRKVTPYEQHGKARHIVIMEPGFAADVGAGLRYEMAPYTVHAEANPNQDPPRFPGCTYLWTFEGVEYFSDGTGLVSKYQVIAGARRDIIDAGFGIYSKAALAPYVQPAWTSPKPPCKGFVQIKGDSGLPEMVGPDKIDISHAWDAAKDDPLAKPTLPQFTFMGQKCAQPVKLIGGISVEEWAIQNPHNYMVCESCGNITGRNAPLDTLMTCHHCHGYRFNCDVDAVTAAAKKLMEGRE